MDTEGKGSDAQVGRIAVPAKAKGEAKVAMKVGRAIEGKVGSKTFVPGTAELLPKLKRELERIRRASVESGTNDVADHSYNFIVTAFNLAAWDHVERGGTRNDWDAYLANLQIACPEMDLMRVSTTYAKHGECSRDDGTLQNVRVSGVAKYSIDPAWTDGIPPNGTTFFPDLEIRFWPKADIAGQSVQMIEVFEAVIKFWRTRLGG